MSYTATSSNVTHVTDASFDRDVLQSAKPVFVDFWAEWCGPCHTLAPVLDAVAAAHGDAVTVAKLNVDENPATAGQYRISAIPAVLIFRDGKLVHTEVGVQPRRRYDELVRRFTAR